MNVWIFFGVAAVVLHVSAPCSRTGFTVVFKILILILMLMVRLAEVQVFFTWRKAALALPNLSFTPASAHPPPPPSLFVNNAT